MPNITNVTVVNQISHLEVQTSNSADYEQGPDDVGVIVNLPVVNVNGGPQRGNGPMSYIYRITGENSDGQTVHIDNLRYSNMTPDGNYQYTTQ